MFHIITSTDVGGAETMLSGLLSATDRRQFAPQVVSLTPPGPVAEGIGSLDVPVHTLGMRRSLPNPLSVRRLTRLLRDERADIVQTWMYHADLVGGTAAHVAGVPVVWNIRHSTLDAGLDRRRTLHVAALLARLSKRIPSKIITNSSAARDAHASRGYAVEKFTLIPNGFDTTVLKPDPEARRDVRRELGIDTDTPLVGLIARFSPHKHHEGFVRAAALVRGRMPDVKFVLCGKDVDETNAELSRWIQEVGLGDAVQLLGRRSNVERVYAALDVLASSSRSEAFPMVVGEAMACGVPCVVTDVGDSRDVVGDCGWVVPANDAVALASGLVSCLRLGADARYELGAKARRRIEEHFALPAIARRYHELYLDVLGAKARPA